MWFLVAASNRKAAGRVAIRWCRFDRIIEVRFLPWLRSATKGRRMFHLCRPIDWWYEQKPDEPLMRWCTKCGVVEFRTKEGIWLRR